MLSPKKNYVGYVIQQVIKRKNNLICNIKILNTHSNN